jgi:hypothetical protein
MQKARLLFLCIVLPFFARLGAQNTFRAFRKLSRPEKAWVFCHPFVAKRAYGVTKLVLAETNVAIRDPRLDTLANGGKIDAFRHCLWMAMLSAKIGGKRASALGQAHEKGNYRQFLHGKTEEGSLPDSVSGLMDLFNNQRGLELRKVFPKDDLETMKEHVIQEIQAGHLLIISRDARGNYLTAGLTQIDLTQWKGHWNIPKSLVPSAVGTP